MVQDAMEWDSEEPESAGYHRGYSYNHNCSDDVFLCLIRHFSATGARLRSVILSEQFGLK